MKSKVPIISCYLTDKNGKTVNSYAPNTLLYTELSSPKKRAAEKEIPGRCAPNNRAVVSIEGYVAVSSDGGAVSVPIPFCIIDTFSIYAPYRTKLNFKVKKFQCCAIPELTEDKTAVDRLKIIIRIETIARSEGFPAFADGRRTAKRCPYFSAIY